MKFTIENSPVFTYLRADLDSGDRFRGEAGAMLSMSPTIDLEAKKTGAGIWGALKVVAGGESFFSSLFTARQPGEVLLAPVTLGDIIRIDLGGGEVFAQGGSFLAGDVGLEISTKGSLRSFIGGEGLFLQKITGAGPLFLSSYGAIIERRLTAGERYIVDTGHMVAFEGGIEYNIRRASKGIFATMASGEGLVIEFSGPGRIWMQTRNLPAFASILSRYLPSKG
ncbi:MAG: TIGR00266 family protein [Chloroflexota bacterium]